jgi:undecaprenyl diphosphate synthase
MSNQKQDLKHVAVIPDGNRRWARERDLKPWRGHKEGAKNLEKVLQKALDLELPYFTFWATSYDNIEKRPQEEVSFLFKLLEQRLQKLLKKDLIHEKEVRIRVRGFWRDMFPKRLKDLLSKAIKETKDYTNYNLTFLLAYNGDQEILKAIRDIAQKGIEPDDIDAEELKDNLLTSDLPSVDYLIRTGGEPHNSAGFMMWDTANSQDYFSDLYWPDFSGADFEQAIEEFKRRERRFGA